MEEEGKQPSSPGTRAVELKECIEELTKFTLESHVNGTLGFDLGLSNDFCSHLLEKAPLYKHLALALYHSISRASLSRVEGSDLKQMGEWSQLVQGEGAALLNVCNSVDFELHVQEPYFTPLKDGLKTVEGRCAAGDYSRIQSGALILFNKCLVLRVEDVHRYASFREMLEVESLERVLPGVRTIDEGVAVYRKFYIEEKEKSNGVLGICVARLATQPYLSLARILSGLSYRGLLMLMDPSHSPGAVPDALSLEIQLLFQHVPRCEPKVQ